MPTRRLHGWTPGSPIDGQRLRLYRNGALAGTYELANDATEKVVDVVADSEYHATLHSFRETQESHFCLEVDFTTVESGGSMPLVAQQQSGGGSGEMVPPPSGEILVAYE